MNESNSTATTTDEQAAEFAARVTMAAARRMEEFGETPEVAVSRAWDDMVAEVTDRVTAHFFQ